MKIIADLHVHSRFSRATSKSLDFVALHRGALEKGIGLVGTGDFTHPGWFSEIEEQLVPAEQGLFELKPELRRQAEEGLPRACKGTVRFVLQVEISNIYKKEDRTRKNHNLIFVPSLDAARWVSEKLAAIGNIASDGRPILGLDARDLLEICLESDPESFLIPAHIWTPWFSMLGSKSGFDSIEECFGDLTEHIFAAETGLSSDPPMNWRLQLLDGLTLVSNSDAHSAAKLGREANLLDIDLGYGPLLRALRDREGFEGTLEFFPEEGKYHLDGHRKCNLRLEPSKTRELGGRCPECGGLITVGVMSRVDELADRPEGFVPEGSPPFVSLVPLAETVGEAVRSGPATKKVQGVMQRLLGKLGPELNVLRDIPLEEIEKVGGAPVAEAVRRVRTQELDIAPGYDGEFGTIKIFKPGERDHLLGQTGFAGFAPPRDDRKKQARKKKTAVEKTGQNGRIDKTDKKETLPGSETPVKIVLNDDQERVVQSSSGPLLVLAGPGTGKTRTLVSRLTRMIRSGEVRPQETLALTFTNQAAQEMEERLQKEISFDNDAAHLVTTFHGLGLRLLKEWLPDEIDVMDDEQRLVLIGEAFGETVKKRRAEELVSLISLAKQTVDAGAALPQDDEIRLGYERYEELKKQRGALDVDDLVLKPYEMIMGDSHLNAELSSRFRSVSVDEYQDVNDVQAALVQALCPGGDNLLAIGDPDQAIYGFRGARPEHFLRFEQNFSGARAEPLGTSYRLTSPILVAAQSVLGTPSAPLCATKGGPKVELVDCPTPKSEAEQIVVRLERLLGGTSLFAVDSGRGSDAEQGDLGFGDVAILTRLKAQHKSILGALEQSGIPARAVAEDEPHDPRSQKVAVMTMHASKGREFEVVFIAGVEPGLVPLALEGLKSDREEERRLLYVAMTRAKRLLVLSHSHKRTLFGATLPGGPSPFLSRIPEDVIKQCKASLPKPSPESRQLRLF
jgi:DNA helicase-2/ATP-dependent DNA helicase PcrA